MTMLKGYTTPSPGAGDGEYGGFGHCAGCEAPSMNAFAASPAEVPYWANQNIARTIPALNGFGFSTDEHVEEMQAQGAQMAANDPLDFKMLAAAAFVGYVLGDRTGALVGAGVGFLFGKKIRAIATGSESLATSPTGFGFMLTGDDFYTDSRGRRVYTRKHSGSGAQHGYGNALVMNPKGVPCPPDSGTWCIEYRETSGSTIPSPKQVATVVDLINDAHPATTIGPTSTGPGPTVTPFQPPAPGNFVQQSSPLDVKMLAAGAAAGYLFRGTTGAVIGAAIAAYLGGRGRSDVNLVPAPAGGGAIVGGLTP